MPEYKYLAQDSKGANVRGKMNAVDEAVLQKKQAIPIKAFVS